MDRRDRQNLAVAILAILLIGGAYWLMSRIHLQGQVEECLMQRRRNCDQLIR